MEKKTFITLVTGIVGGLLFSLGMCMCLLPDWGMTKPGIALGLAGAVVLLATWIAYLRQTGKQPIHLNIKTVLKVLYALLATLVFGVGMCMTMVFENMMFPGIIVGIVGIVLLLFLIPMCMGFKDGTEEI